ncbi:MAG: D-alanyl-D-alanine carboxypeptidase family protein, partial [Roseinatronobacter sp.]
MAAVFFMAAMLAAGFSHAAPYAAMVMDARNGEVIFARNHDTKLHPASLTKMMTLYVTFEAIKHGEITLDTQFTVSRGATQTTCVCLGLRPGQKISVRYLIRAAALRSANDAAVVLAEGVSGSVEAFAERMTRTARAMGMENTTFRNPH